MTTDKENTVIDRINNALKTLEGRESVIYFFVADTKGYPNAKMEYIYEFAYTLHKSGYNVCMVYQLENEYTDDELSDLNSRQELPDDNRRFIGVSDWLGVEYSQLRHLNVAKEQWNVAPSDFLFIPEVFSSLMKETFDRHVPCKRYVILQNMRHITEFMTFGDQWANYGIKDAIVTNSVQESLLKSVFRYVDTTVINPCFPLCFNRPENAKRLIVNMVTKNQNDAEHIVKLFYWKYPLFQFVPFRDLRNFPKEKYADFLKEGAITVWVDYDTPFGNNAIESMKCGCVTIGKIPETIPEWMGDDNKLKDNGYWVNSLNDIPDVLMHVINDWMEDLTPEIIYDEMKKTSDAYTQEKWAEDVSRFADNMFLDRINEIKEIKESVEKKAVDD